MLFLVKNLCLLKNDYPELDARDDCMAKSTMDCSFACGRSHTEAHLRAVTVGLFLRKVGINLSKERAL